ncbi:hypothetical protein ACGFYZ_01550 [Streptomyces sp. NPDC048330]|uniref:hypothetical protein n=1 Tax=Streptomyces sp. NPDC048330 TaxID=3365533 RepID=UPI00371BEB01
MGGLVGEDHLPAERPEDGVRVRVHDHPVGGGLRAAARLPGGDGGDAPVGGGRAAEEAAHRLDRGGDEDHDPARPAPVPRPADRRHRPVRRGRDLPQPLLALPDPEDEAAPAGHRLHRALLPQLLRGPLGGAVAGDVPAAVPLGEVQDPRGGGGPGVVALDPVPELGLDGGPALAGRVDVGDPVVHPAQRDLREPVELGAGGRRERGVQGRQIAGLVPVEQGLGVAVQEVLDLLGRRAGRARRSGGRAAGEGRQGGQQAHGRAARHSTAPTCHALDRTGAVAGPRQTRVTVTCDIMFTGS